MSVELTTQQIDHICYQIGKWYIKWQDKMWIEDKPNQHWLGVAKEQLKTMICGDEYKDNSEELKTEIEKRDEKIKLLENVSMILGIVHGAIAVILEGPEHEIKEKLIGLFNQLDKDVSKIFYPVN